MKNLLDVDDLAEYFGIAKDTIYAWTSKKNRRHVKLDLPEPIRLGRLLRWRREDVDSFVKSKGPKTGNVHRQQSVLTKNIVAGVSCAEENEEANLSSPST